MVKDSGASDGQRSAERAEVERRTRVRQVERVEQFVLRARRIAAHSLAQDRDALLRLAKMPMRISGVSGGRPTMAAFDLLPEEVVESAAARVRPLMLSGDGIYLPTVVKAVESLLKGTDKRVNKAALTDRWAQRTNPNVGSGVTMQTYDPAADAFSERIDGTHLAKAWFYGHALHHDTSHLARTRGYSPEYRFAHGTALTAFVMLRALTLLDVVTELKQGGYLADVNEDVWTEPVVVEKSVHEIEVEGVAAGPVGSSPPADWWAMREPSPQTPADRPPSD